MQVNKKLLAMAKAVRKFAHIPYSGYAIGAAIRLKNGKMYSGCNIENASYGGTVCAERVAIWKAMSENKSPIAEVVVISDAEQPWPPCGLCRQVIAEFATPATVVHSGNLDGKIKSALFAELLPDAFEPRYLKKSAKKK